MDDLEARIRAKIPGEDTGITTRNTVCDICAPGPHCGVTCCLREGKMIKVEGTQDHPVNHGKLCTRGQASRGYVYRKDRILTPLKRVGPRGEGSFAPISWEQAWEEIVTGLNALRTQYDPSCVAFYSGYSKWYRPFLQRLCYSFGSVNYGTESSSCFTSSVMSWNLATGADTAGPDLGRAGLFLGWCYNACDSAYLMAAGVERARARGMKVIIVDPRITPAAERQCDLHLRPRPGTDCALALALARELIAQDWVDRDYIAQHVYGYEEYRQYVQAFTPERCEALTGVPAHQVRLAARMIHESMPLAIHASNAALTHHVNGMQTHRAVMALSALMGTYDRPGGVVPAPKTYAHSMAGFTTLDHEFPLERYPKNGPRPVGAQRFPLWEELVGEMQACDLARQIREGTPYPIRGLWAHGMNFRMFNGDREMEQALRQLDFFVDTDLFLTDSAKLADLVLPCCTSFERSEFKVYGGGYGQWTQPVISPLGESRPDDEIICELARRLDLKDGLLTAGPEACVRYMLRETPVDVDFLKAHSQFPQKLAGVKTVPVGEHGFATPTGKFELCSTVIAKYPGLDPLPTWRDCIADTDPDHYPFCLVAGARLPWALHSRLHDVPWLRSLRPEPTADLNDRDARELGISPGDRITLTTQAGSVTVRANPTARVLAGCVFLYHGYREADVNAIVPPGHNDPYSGFPGYRSVACAISRAEEEEACM